MSSHVASEPAAPSEDSADVFVSYSRSDQAFVRELVEELAARGKNAWVDWEGIPPTAEWLAEIQAAIEGSDAFLFVISPSSAASAMCREELAHAEKLGKRIVPVSLDAVDPSALPPALADRQWIGFDGATPLEQSVDTLVLALDTDLEWVRAHTQWLGKAREWERHGRDGSFLLRGSELRAAESWLAAPGAADKEPPTTPLQNEYVLASRQASARRQRRLVLAVTLALAVTSALAVLALVQRNRANAQREIAISELAANVSGQRLGTALDTALLLAAAAYEIEDTVAARDALLTAMRRTVDVARLMRIDPPHLHVPPVFSRNGRLLATVSQGEIVVVEVATGGRVASIPAPDPSALALDATGSVLATASGDRVELWMRSAAGDLLPEPRAYRVPGASALALAPRGDRLAIGNDSGRVFLVDVTAGRLEAVRGLEAQSILSLAFDPSGTRLAAGSVLGVHLVTMDGPRYQAAWLEDEAVSSLAFTATGELSLITGDRRFVVVDARTGERRCEPSGAYSTLHVSAGGTLTVGGQGGSLRIRKDACSSGGRALRGHGSSIAAIGSIGGGERMASVDASGLVVVWELRKSSLAERTETGLADMADVVHGLAGDDVIVGGSAGVARVTRSGTVRALSPDRPGTESLASAPAARALVAAGRLAALWRGPRYEPASWLGEQEALRAALSPDASLLALGSRPGIVEAWSLEPRRRVVLSTGVNALVTALAADDGRVAAGDATGRVVLWELEPTVERTILRPQGDRVTSVDALAFAPGGRVLAAASEEVLEVYDVSARTSHSLAMGSPVDDLAFVASGAQLVTGHADGSLRVWDLRLGRMLGEPLRTGTDAIRGIDVSPTGTALVAVSGGGTVYRLTEPVWDPRAAKKRACALAGGPLTADVWTGVATGFPLPRPCESPA